MHGDTACNYIDQVPNAAVTSITLEYGTRPLDVDIPPSEMLNRLHVRDTQKPLIAAVHGFAIGAGFGIALGCDYRIATSDARFAYTDFILAD